MRACLQASAMVPPGRGDLQSRTEGGPQDGQLCWCLIRHVRSTTSGLSDGGGARSFLSASFAHDEAGLRSLCAALVRLKVELVAIERPDGLLVERLLDAGLRVLAIHPNQVAATRDRFRAAGGKSDRFDAFVLCELARTDARTASRVLEPDSDETQALKALTRARRDIVESRTAASNQLHAELERFWAGPLRLFSTSTARSRWRSSNATRARVTSAASASSASARS